MSLSDLVFMPGLAEITDLFNMMREHPELGDSKRYRILPLHSSLLQRSKRLLVPPKGVTKFLSIIFETSVTINDISVVIDAGTHKEMQYDPSVGMSCLQEVKSQRQMLHRGLVMPGRVRPGEAYHLFLRKELEYMSDQQLPEMKRCPLESTALKIKALKLGYVDEFLAKAIEPPSQAALNHVISVLRGLTAMDTSGADMSISGRFEELTPLGVLLANCRSTLGLVR